MTIQELTQKAHSLKELSYSDWLKLRIVMDAAFCEPKRELELQLKLPEGEYLDRVIRSQFG